jgi:HEPN domain-containing protein
MTVFDMTKEWLQYADNDLISARHLFEDLYPRQTQIAAYLTQQCAEKSLKAFLILNEIEPPRTHNLLKLYGLCAALDNNFSMLENDCQYLNPYGSGVRYPGELVIDESIVEESIKRAQKVYDFCVAKAEIIGLNHGTK